MRLRITATCEFEVPEEFQDGLLPTELVAKDLPDALRTLIAVDGDGIVRYLLQAIEDEQILAEVRAQ